MSPFRLRIAAVKTIVWARHSYKPLTLKAGTLVRFKWSGFHNLAVSKLNEKSARSEHLTDFIKRFERGFSPASAGW